MASVLNDLGVGNQGITREKFMPLSYWSWCLMRYKPEEDRSPPLRA